ncbi:reverse transcriptase domain-containing protein, partial [Tanacetum coccineum]
MLIRNAPFILRKWNPSSKLSKEELTFVPVWIKFHGVLVSAFIVDSLGHMDYARVLVDIRAGRALKDTMVISVPNPTSNGVTMHTIKLEYEWKPPRCGTCLVFGHDDAQCPKRVIADLRNLRKQGGTSNDGFQTVQRNGVRDPLVSKHGSRGDISIPKQHVPKSVYQKKTTSTPVSNSFSALGEDNGKPIDDLVDATTGKISLRDLKESGDDANVDDDTTTSSKSL